MRRIIGREQIEEQAEDLLGDESNLSGSWCEEAAWPATVAEAESYVRSCAGRGLGLTISGGRTGVTGGALPEGGAVLSTGLLQGIGEIEGGTVRVAAGTTLEQLREFLDESPGGLFFPPDPTEWSATLGGMAATDASGSDSLMHGSTRRWITALHTVFSTGEASWVRRGDHAFGKDGICTHPSFGRLALPAGLAALPDKDTAGYRMRPGMDLVDLLLGSEGTLCLITELELRLAHVPAHTVEVVMFPGATSLLWPALGRLHGSWPGLRALELMDDRCLDLMRADPLPDGIQPPQDACCAVMARMDADSDAELDRMLEVLDTVSAGLGLPERLVWAGLDEAGDTRIRRFRHQLPELVNREIARRAASVPGIHKLGSDSAVGFDRAARYHDTIRSLIDSEGFEGIVFGHAGQGHLHANILPRNSEEMERARGVMLEIARAAVREGGTVSAEHGLGRIKAHLLREMHPPVVIAGMSALRRAIDPAGLFNPAVGWA